MGRLWKTDQEQEMTWPACPAGPGSLVLEQPARLVLAQRREVGPPPGLAATCRGLSPGPQGILVGLLGLPSGPTPPGPGKELLGSSPQRLENEVHAASPLHPGGDDDFLDDLGVAGGLSDDDVGPGGQQSPVVTIWGCRHMEEERLSDLGSHSLETGGTGGQGASAWRAADSKGALASVWAWNVLPTASLCQTPIHPSKPCLGTPPL